MKRWLHRAARIAALVLLGLIVVSLAGTVWLRGKLVGSLPRLDGSLVLAGLSAPVTIDRDDLGVPTIHAGSRIDLARATGFLHAQERFFQMDLLRRSAAGELAELIGPAVVSRDRETRVHRFRDRARQVVASIGGDDRHLVEAYTQGVNEGLRSLGAVPFEYLALRVAPEPWSEEDSILVVHAMYLDLQGGQADREVTVGLLHDLLPSELFDFLVPRGTEWDAPVVGSPLATAPIPPADRFDLRHRGIARSAAGLPYREIEPVPGSNSWVVAGSHTADGAALLANDMHLALALPNTWYRVSLVWPDAGRQRRATGVTLPGAPPIVAGSNGDVAWGFTNSHGDWSDLVVLEPVPGDPSRYSTAEGPRAFERFEERIEVRGQEAETLEVLSTIWGPVVDRDHRGRQRALRWVAHDTRGVNMGLVRMETATTIEEAFEVASLAGIPTENCVIAERGGRIGWTVMGPVPRRFGLDGRWPESWAGGDRGWEGYLVSDAYPRITDPESGRIWTANNLVDPDHLIRLGDGGYGLGARARQIRDDLLGLAAATPADMLAIQLDDRALLLARWRELLLATLDAEAVAADPRRATLRQIVDETWTGRASVDSAAYERVRAFRLALADQVFDALTAPCKAADDRFTFRRTLQWEGPLWKLVTEQPPHLLDPRRTGWRAQFLAAADEVLERFAVDVSSAERNRVRIQHPLSLAVPFLSRWLDMTPEPLPGGDHVPRVQGRSFGASQRMAVSPGREEQGIFHMPGGQSGHPLSPYYRKGHEAWAEGRAAPFLPGPSVHHLTLVPSG